MSDSTPIPAAQVARTYVAPGTVWDVARNRDHTTGAGALIPQDLGATTDRPGVWLRWTMIAGLPVPHGEVADEAAMLALHSFAMDSADNPTPRYVAPGDSCTRADDPGWRWYCLTGHGLTLADWERRPLAGALTGLAVAGHTHTIAQVSGLSAALAEKQNALSNAAALARISAAADDGGPPKWDGGDWPGGGAGSSPVGSHWFGPARTGRLRWPYAAGRSPTGGIFSAAAVVRVSHASAYIGSAQTVLRCGSATWILRGEGYSPSRLACYVRLSDGVLYGTVSAGGAWVDAEWHTVAMSCAGTASTMSLYLDGVLIAAGGTAITSVAAESAPALDVGNWEGLDEGLCGWVRRVRVWAGTALTSEQHAIVATGEDPLAPTCAADLDGAAWDSVGDGVATYYGQVQLT